MMMHRLHQKKRLQLLIDRDSEHLNMITSTKLVVEDSKLLIDTFGSTVTEACERMSEDSKTVFARVEDANAKLENLHETELTQHGLTREDVQQTLSATIRLEGNSRRVSA